MSEVAAVDAGPRRVAREVEVAAPDTHIFELLADPRRHSELDGSGTVRPAVTGPARLGPAVRFTVSMKQAGIPYRIPNRVVAFEQDRVLAWRHPVGHVWRWELTRLSPERTRVTETFDYSRTWAARMFELSGRTTRNATAITQTLQQLRRRFDE